MLGCLEVECEVGIKTYGSPYGPIQNRTVFKTLLRAGCMFALSLPHVLRGNLLSNQTALCSKFRRMFHACTCASAAGVRVPALPTRSQVHGDTKSRVETVAQGRPRPFVPHELFTFGSRGQRAACLNSETSTIRRNGTVFGSMRLAARRVATSAAAGVDAGNAQGYGAPDTYCELSKKIYLFAKFLRRPIEV
eukprot:1175512-Prorocentrum_minimum.AAC.2